MRNKKVLFITQGAVIAAIYVVLTYIVSLLGLTNGVIQVRLSEALTILPVFTPAARALRADPLAYMLMESWIW